MANFNSTVIANAIADPFVANPAGQVNGRVRVASQATTHTSTVTANTFRLCRLPTNARVISIKIASDVIVLVGAADVGLADTDGVAIDADLFDLTLDGGLVVQDVRFAQLTVATAGQMLFELLGQASDPGGEFELLVTDPTGIAKTDGTMFYEVLFTVT